MGCFDYECGCGGESCEHVGGQLNNSEVIIEVPLSDGTVVYLKGEYEQYGYVTIKIAGQPDTEYKFYLKEFEEYFDGWFDREPEEELNKCFLANKAWTRSETTCVLDRFGDETEGYVKRRCFYESDVGDNPLTNVDQNLLSKCTLADHNSNEKLKKRIAYLKAECELAQKKLRRKLRP